MTAQKVKKWLAPVDFRPRKSVDEKETKTKHRSAVLNQLCKLIPVGMVSSLAKEYQVDKKSRTFSPWSHVVSLLYCQLTHCIGLNDLCDALRHHSAKLFAIRGYLPLHRVATDSRMRTRSVMLT